MQISSRFTIAAHIFSCIGHFGMSSRITSDFLASSIGVNPVIVRQILSKLHAAGLIDVARGTGGITLRKAPSGISFLDIFNALGLIEDGKLFHFHEKPCPKCPVGANIHAVLDGRLAGVQKAMEAELSKSTVQDIFDDTERIISGMAQDRSSPDGNQQARLRP